MALSCCSYFHFICRRFNPWPLVWSGFGATSVVLTEALAIMSWAYKVFGIIILLRGICNPGLALSMEADIWLLGVVVFEEVLGSGLAGEVGDD